MKSALQVHKALPGRIEEAGFYHDVNRGGYFALLYERLNGKRQRSYPMIQMPSVLNSLDPTINTWMSQAEFFRANRRLVYLRCLGLSFVDMDTYRLDHLRGRPTGELSTAVNLFCRDEGIPRPSLIVFSGRGLQVKWLFENAIPHHALPRWDACQKRLVNRLAAMGADPAAKDASRVLRVMETVNSKSGEMCRVIHVNERDGEPIRYGFDMFCDEILPISRRDLEIQQQERVARAKLRLLKGSQTGRLILFSGSQLAWHRLEDLRKLAELRGGVVEGERMLHLFWRLNFLLLYGEISSRQLYFEAGALAKELDPRWNHRSGELSSLYHKAKAYEAGERVEFNGKKYPPLYTPKNDTLINLFRITDDEQRQLRTIISTDIAKERDRERDTAWRRSQGAMERTVYEEQSISRRKPWESLGISRRTWYRQGKPEA